MRTKADRDDEYTSVPALFSAQASSWPLGERILFCARSWQAKSEVRFGRDERRDAHRLASVVVVVVVGDTSTLLAVDSAAPLNGLSAWHPRRANE